MDNAGQWWEKMAGDKRWHLYMLRCADGSLYTGITTEVERRVAEHRGEAGPGRGAKSLRGRRPLTLVFETTVHDRSEALRLEYQVKKLRRTEKEALVQGDMSLLALKENLTAMSEKERQQSSPRIPVGVSSCLLGERVRYDGGHKGHSYITGTLGEYFDFKPFCPELAIGLGVPRKPIRLRRAKDNAIRCVQIEDESRDFTDALTACADEQREWQQQLCGYILKKDSPSCGMERVKVWDEVMPAREGVGIYAKRLMDNFPWLPVEEEGRLGDAVLRENFIQRVFAMRRWHELMGKGLSVAGLVDFHARHKLILMSHDQAVYRKLGRLVAATDKDNLAENAASYLHELMAGLKKRATRKNHVNVLQHIQGYLKKHLDAEDKQELVQTLEKYRKGQVPLIVPVTLLNHFFRKHPDEYIARSYYMNPYPEELCLQNVI